MGWARGNQGQRTAMPNLVAFWCVSIGGCLKIRLSQLLRSSRWRGFPPVGCQRGGLGPAPCHAYVLVWLVGIHSWRMRSSISFSLRNYLALLLRESSFTCLLWLGRTGLGLQDLRAYALQVMFVFVALIPLLYLGTLTLWLYLLLISFTETRSLLWAIIGLKAIF